MTTAAIIVGGEKIPLKNPDRKVVLFTEGGPEFSRLTTRGVKPRTAKIDLITFHDTAGEGSGIQTYNTLRARGFAVHFQIARDGTITQYCDPLVLSCAHMGPGNGRSVGIEDANCVFPPGIAPGLFANIKRYTLKGKERLMGRPVVIEPYRGAPRRELGHFPEQKASAGELTLALLTVLPVPAALPRGPDGKIHADRLPADWSGVAGHLHFTDAHVDPVLDLFDDLLTVL